MRSGRRRTPSVRPASEAGHQGGTAVSVNDPIADMLTRIRNACMARHTTVQVPSSKMKLAIAQILQREGFIREFTVKSGTPYDTIEITLKYTPDRRPVITGPKGVEIKLTESNYVTVKGPKGVLEQQLPTDIMIKQENGVVEVSRPSD